MTLRNGVLFLVLMTAAIAGSGCSRTLVAALPVGTTTTCDAAWPGRWAAIPPEDRKGKHGEKAWLEINADCSVLTSIDEHGKRERENHKLTLISTRSGDFLWIADGDGKPPLRLETECLSGDKTHCGMELMRYVRNGDEIRLYSPDHRAVHAAIGAGSVPGYTEIADDSKAPASNEAAAPSALTGAQAAHPSQGSKTHYNNLIAGDPEQITTILEQHPEFFDSTPWMTLQRDTHPKRKKHR